MPAPFRRESLSLDSGISFYPRIGELNRVRAVGMDDDRTASATGLQRTDAIQLPVHLVARPVRSAHRSEGRDGPLGDHRARHPTRGLGGRAPDSEAQHGGRPDENDRDQDAPIPLILNDFLTCKHLHLPLN